VTRIIAGTAGSRTLEVPKSGTRPTSDRVREAIFSGLEARGAIAGACVLDLYAGSGALGLEAASRGAARVQLVERSSAAAAACRRNAGIVRDAFATPAGTAGATGAPGAAGQTSASGPLIDVARATVSAFLAGGTASWDVVFIDPPYELDEAELAGNLRDLVPHLSAGATVVLERSTRSPEPVWPAGLLPDRHRAYGDTTLWFASTPT
jgi:16S rRNA (guanine966-N2)-methyltransferase